MNDFNAGAPGKTENHFDYGVFPAPALSESGNDSP